MYRTRSAVLSTSPTLIRAHSLLFVYVGVPRDLRLPLVLPRTYGSTQRVLPGDTVYVSDSGNGTVMCAEHLRLRHPRCIMSPCDYSSMGFATPAAIGAAIAKPQRPVVATVGDGAFMMTGLELATAVHHKVRSNCIL